MIAKGQPLNDLQKERWQMDGPDCDACLGDEEGGAILLPGNVDAWEVYQATRSQLIVSMGGAVSINQLTVWEYLDRHESLFMKPKNEIFEQVCRVAQEIINYQNEEARIERELKGK